MRLIFLYGPPASGKYSIAKLLAEKTGYKLFHNHVTVDLVSSIFEHGTKPFSDLIHKIRLTCFEQITKSNIPGAIFTYVYKKPTDDPFIKKIIKKVISNGGEMVFIQIYCDKTELQKRVIEESRKQFSKIKTEELLLQILDGGEFFSAIPFVKSTKIDNTNLSVTQAVNKVIELIDLL